MMSKQIVVRGEIWLFDPDPTVGHEQAKKRPCLVVSTTGYNNSPAGLIVVLPITSKFKPLPWFLLLEPKHSGLKMISYIICDQVRAISKERLIGPCLGTVDEKILSLVEQRLKILLEL